MPQCRGAECGAAGPVAASSAAAVPGTDPLCHPEGRGGVGRAGGRLRDHEEQRACPFGVHAPHHQRSGGDGGRHFGGHPRPSVQSGILVVEDEGNAQSKASQTGSGVDPA